MKFARYLEDTQIPEWKRAYIDYRGLKKRITAIRIAQENDDASSHNSVPPAPPLLSTSQIQTTTVADGEPSQPRARSFLAEIAHEEDEHDSDAHHATPEPRSSHESDVPHDRTSHASAATPRTRARILAPQETEHPDSYAERPGILRSATLNMGFLPRLARGKTGRNGHNWDRSKSIPLKDLLPALNPLQKAFFDKLDGELDKVETFYVEREKEMHTRVTILKGQLHELQEHRRVFHEAEEANSWLHLRHRKIYTLRRQSPSGTSQRVQSKSSTRKRRSFKGGDSDTLTRPVSAVSDNKTLEESIENPRITKTRLIHSETSASDEGTLRVNSGEVGGSGSGSGSSGSGGEEVPKGWKKVRHNFQRHVVSKKPGSPSQSEVPKYDPDEYTHAKKSLKKAVLECYRGLEVLENYRTLNLIGFRKALKKFEKVTQIPAQQAYFVEKIEPCAFSSGAAVQGMISQVEEMYAARFTRGDNKLAKNKLRGGEARQKTRHWSVFRTGVLLGIALPAFVDAIYRSFQPDTRQALPGHDGLLYIYSVFLIPVLFILLVGVNILGWHQARINYVFIFEFDLKTKIDHRQFFEIPAVLLATLCYACWLTFAQVGSSQFSPTLWPLIWLIWAGILLFNPLPVFARSARAWFLRNLSRLLTSGFHRVEFADFWMGDQYCSLVYPLSNLYLVACAYSGGIDSTWSQCLSPKPWGIPFVLAALPLLARFVQSIRRWVDSRLITHLINGGKYGSGIIYYLTYYNWRHHGGGRGGDFILWCIMGTIYASYSSAWDFLMDWSLLRPHAKHPLLRDNLLYSNHIVLYYIAIVTNVLIRFIWVLYIPQRGPPFALRTFIAAVLEMLRRWQWNFYRLENEHLGNVDQYRVTREVPLPYSFDDAANESDADDDERKSISSWRSRRRAAKAQASQDVYRIGTDLQS